MRRLVTQIAAIACCLACGSSAFAQFQDRQTDRFQSRAERRLETYVFGEKAHVPRLTSNLYKQANVICWEMYRHYNHNQDYKTIYREMYEIRKAAIHIQGLVKEDYYRRTHSDDHIVRDLHEMDKWFHHVETDVHDWRPDVARTSPGGDLHAKMGRLKETLHHVMKDYGMKSKIEQTVRRNTRDDPFQR
jgi:hypothetical protein